MYVVDYRQQPVEPKEPGVTSEEMVNDGRKLEDQLYKDEELRVQKKELMKLRSMHVWINNSICMYVVLYVVMYVHMYVRMYICSRCYIHTYIHI